MNYLKIFNQVEPEKILEEIKTTRIGVLDKVVQGKKDQYLHEREIDIQSVLMKKKYIEILKKIYNKELKGVYDIMENFKLINKRKRIFSTPTFYKESISC